MPMSGQTILTMPPAARDLVVLVVAVVQSHCPIHPSKEYQAVIMVVMEAVTVVADSVIGQLDALFTSYKCN